MLKIFATSLVLIFWAGAAIAEISETLNTKNFKVKIITNCAEGIVGCDRITYQGTDKTTGKSIKLSGKQIMRMCADGVTPCQSLGYEFVNGDYTYFVSEDGRLSVYQGKKLILNEAGKWQN